MTLIRGVALFTGCFYNYYDPSVSHAAVEVLRNSGIKVAVPEQICCGLPMEAKGNYRGVSSNLTFNTRSFLRLISEGYYVVTLCPSCNLFIRRHYGRVGGKEGQILAQSISFLSEFLLRIHKLGRLRTNFKHVTRSIFYQTPCHLAAAGIGQPSVELLRLIPGLDIKCISTECCGLSGTWGYEKKNAALSLEIGRKLFEDLHSFRTDYVVTDCGSCRMQILSGTGITAQHPVTIFNKACSR